MKMGFLKHSKIRLAILVVGLALLFPLPSGADTQILLEWQPNVESDVGGYRVYSRMAGENYNYAEPAWEGIQNSCVIEVPEDPLPYYFVVRAFKPTGSVSPDSGEVCFGCILCPDDPDKTYAGICGCGIPDKDIDVDSIWDCQDSDDDNDGIEDTIEDNGPHQGDGNLDGVLDSQQCNVGSLLTEDDVSYIVIESSHNTCIDGFNRVDNPSPDNIPQGIDLALGLYEYEIHNIELDEIITVTITLPEGVTPDTYYTYGVTPENQTDHWYELNDDGDTGVDIDENIVQLFLADAQRGDNDLVSDCRVRGLGGPAFIMPDPGLDPDPDPVLNSNPDAGIVTDTITDIDDPTTSDGGCFFNTLFQ